MSRFKRAVVVVVAALALAPSHAWAQSSDDFFNDQVVHRLDLRIHSADLEKLHAGFRTNQFYPADVVWRDVTVRNVGVRSRGLGSRNDIKIGIRVDADHFTTAQRFLGMRAFVLDNLWQDASGIHETTAMKLFNRMNIYAPREAHARLYINNEYHGLYAVVEEINKDFLTRAFGEINGDIQNDGHLYEYNFIDHWTFNYFGSDLEPYKQRFSAKTHEKSSDQQLYRRIEEIVRLVNDLPSDRYMEQLDPKLDLRQFIRYVAIQNFLGENDGFLGYDGMNNFYWCRKENSDQFVFIAWDEDNAFWGAEYGLTMRHDENVLFRKAMEVGELRDLYYATLAEAAQISDERVEGSNVGWLENEMRTRFDLIYDAMNEDPRKPYSMDDFNRERSAMLNFARERGRYVRNNVPR
jgi:spore coat protein H